MFPKVNKLSKFKSSEDPVKGATNGNVVFLKRKIDYIYVVLCRTKNLERYQTYEEDLENCVSSATTDGPSSLA